LRAVSRYKLKDEKVMQDEFIEALRVFDRQEVGQLSVAELREALKSHGEALTDEDLDEIIALADVKEDGTFDYMGKWNYKLHYKGCNSSILPINCSLC
jgi:Ca2+-binding EF-hand superfamily protein